MGNVDGDFLNAYRETLAGVSREDGVDNRSFPGARDRVLACYGTSDWGGVRGGSGGGRICEVEAALWRPDEMLESYLIARPP